MKENTVVIDPKRRRVEHATVMGLETEERTNRPVEKDGPKNLREAAPVRQSRLNQ